MTTTGLHDLVTSTGDDGTRRPAERIWTLDQEPAALGFSPVLGGPHITGLPAPDADAGDHSALFVILGHHRWATTIHAAALYMQRLHAWTCGRSGHRQGGRFADCGYTGLRLRRAASSPSNMPIHR
ncbi:hypothetical protein ACFQ9J_26040 [Streptomyces sp. NPDC056529]|uniref:hypothetical protein n=1 Tax=Streptomyces sp. NPDC056529 TaxID=3345855 RepID=UPI00367E224C